MRRVIGWSIPLVLIMIGLLWPLVFTGGGNQELPADDPVVFSNFKADFRVNADGSMDAVETITAEFPSGRHGLFQYWDTSNQNHPYVRQVPDIQSVEVDGAPAPYQMLWESGKRFRVAKIGDPDEYLSYGTHVFEIRYTVPGVLDPGDTGSDKRFAKSTGDDAAAAVGVLLECRRGLLEQPDATGRHLGHAAERCHRRTVFGRRRGRCAVSRPHHHRQQGRALDPVPGVPHAGHAEGRRRRTHAGARRTAVALYLGSDPRHVADRDGVDPVADRGLRPRRLSLVPHHG